MLCIPSRLSNETFIWFDSWTKNNHFLLGKMVEVLGGSFLLPLTSGICEWFACGDGTWCNDWSLNSGDWIWAVLSGAQQPMPHPGDEMLFQASPWVSGRRPPFDAVHNQMWAAEGKWPLFFSGKTCEVWRVSSLVKCPGAFLLLCVAN